MNQKISSKYLFLFFLLISLLSFSQSNKTIKIQAENAMNEKDWYSAAVLYGKLVARDSSNVTVNYNYAEASRLNFDLDIASYWYNKVIAVDNGKKFPLCFYWKAQILQYKGNYKEAKKWYSKFSKSRKAKSAKYAYYTIKAALQAEACDMAQVLITNPVSYKIIHLDTAVNSKVSEYAAFEKDSTLYFSSLRTKPKKYADDEEVVPMNKVYSTDTKMGKWQKVKTLDTNINATYLHNANICFSDDYKQMIISRCKNKNATEYTCELYESKLMNNKWQPMTKLGEPINLKGYSTSQPNYGKINDSTFLFFASTRPGGEGGYDIWYAYKKTDGSFDKPINAGKKVNTPDDDITPWYINDQKQLYFSSTYHKGLGGFDIFRSELKNRSFNDAVNAGYPINSSYNDIYYSVNKEGTYAYLSSNRIGSYFEHKLNCCNDIYRYQLEPKEKPQPPIDTVKLLTGQMKVLVPLTLYFHNDEPDAKTKAITTKKNYQKTYDDYIVLKPEYLREYSSNLEKEKVEDAKEKVEDFFADSVDVGMNDLTKFAGLLEQVLAKNEKVKITMKGYCSPLASTDYNVNLAKRRISSLRNYFYEYKGGMFVKYIDNKNDAEGKITFEDVEIGELPVSKVSDDLKDKKNSVYSPFAARERKIQIIAVSFGE
jgi:outer membrane protein OmpA-like peptidoglycan-associated protein